MPKPVEPRTQKAFRHLTLEEKAEILHLLDDKVARSKTTTIPWLVHGWNMPVDETWENRGPTRK